jgi:uncharacterized membrane protein
VSTWTRHRVLGVDAARGVALLGMMAVHIVPAVDADGEVTLAFHLAAGRSSALFAVLAGVGLALLTRWTAATSGRQRARDRINVATRALLLVGLGLALGIPEAGVAVILVYYGVFFVLALPFLGLSARALAAWSLGTVVLAPVLSHALRPHVPPASYAVPTLDFFDRPWWDSLSELTLTGYYPALPWMAYLFAGLAVGKLDLRSRTVAWWLLGGGAAVAVAARVVSAALLDRFGGLDVLRAQTAELFGGPLEQMLTTGLFGTTPTGSWWWLAVAAPHTATSFDLATTIGAALAVLGFFLLVLTRPQWWAAPLVAVGGMTLTLYSLHIVLLDTLLPRTMPMAYGWHVVAVVVFALVWRALLGQGPLERLTQLVSRTVSRVLVPGANERPVGDRPG